MAPEALRFDEDHWAMRAALASGGALCTIARIDGAFSRRRGSQLAIAPDGTTSGNLSDGCLERELAERERQPASADNKRSA